MKRISTREVGCTGKAALSAKDAQRIARNLREKGDRVVPYKCPHCGRWHIGNSLMREGRRGRPRFAEDGGFDA